MNRCSRPAFSATTRWRQAFAQMAFLGLAAVATLAFTPWQSAQAQTESLQRPFPAKAQRGTLVVTQPPYVTIDGEKARLSPGSRIMSTRNTVLRSSSLVGQEHTVNYVLDGRGAVHQAWILTAAEAAQKLPGARTTQNFNTAPDEPTSATPSAN